jgi:hypothetical protein
MEMRLRARWVSTRGWLLELFISGLRSFDTPRLPCSLTTLDSVITLLLSSTPVCLTTGLLEIPLFLCYLSGIVQWYPSRPFHRAVVVDWAGWASV